MNQTNLTRAEYQLRLKSLLETANDEKMRPGWRKIAIERAERLVLEMETRDFNNNW